MKIFKVQGLLKEGPKEYRPMAIPSHLDIFTTLQHLQTTAYGRKSVDRISTQSMSKICNLWRLIVVECDYADSYGRVRRINSTR